MQIEIRHADFEPFGELSHYQMQLADPALIGACASFVGTMRDFNEGNTVTTMTLEYYPGMTEKQLQKIVANQIKTHQLSDALVIHRVGLIQPKEAIVLVACWSAHRKQAFEACRAIMESLKHQAPFWKKEQTLTGERWVEKNTQG